MLNARIARHKASDNAQSTRLISTYDVKSPYIYGGSISMSILTYFSLWDVNASDVRPYTCNVSPALSVTQAL